jgi:WD40 repeat protein/serine/threonine protein kinase
MDGPRTQPRKTQQELFLEALERPTPGERTAFLDEACAHEPSLRAAVEALLQHHKEDGFLESSAFVAPPATHRSDAATPAVVGERPGDRVGCYRLLEQIGEGGVGVVFMADQEVPVRRRVALKVLKPGMDTKAVVARFESERQALALMDHPNIAKVLDAGSTATGRPFVVMELVRGVRFTEYCDQNRLPTRERLALSIQVCHAIQHAHQKGIIHRDIKPSNILVTLHDGVPVPKVIDFGIAKAIDKVIAQRLTDKTLFTEFQSFIGTPAYISPEQAEMSGLDIDTRADIYSLGVLLYEVLTGTTPFDARELLSSGLDAMRRTIREREPAPPSTRLGTLPEDERTTTAHRQRVEPARLVSQLRGDLDWIVLKALEKDRTRRYATANDLALDMRRYLDNEPILARPASAAYRFQKLVRRNKLVFAGASAVAAALVIGLAISAWQYSEKSAAYRRIVDGEQEQSRLRLEADAARRAAEAQALVAVFQAYAADMNLVQQSLAVNNLGRAQELLNRHRPEGKAKTPGPIPENSSGVDSLRLTDLRGWEWRYLWRQNQSDALFTLCQLPSEVSALSVSHDGKWVAVGEYGDRGISIWDLRARQEIARFPAGEGSERFAFSPVAPLLAFYAKRRPGGVRLWDVVDRRVVGELALSGHCRAVAFSADGARLLTASGDAEFAVWSVAQGVKLASVAVSEPKGARAPLGGCLAVTRDLGLAVEALGGGRIRVMDLASGQERWTAQAADEHVTALTFSPDGRKVASGAGYVESSVRLWDAADGRELARLEGHRTYVRSLVFWPDGETMASASGDQTIHLWDVSDLGAPLPVAAPLSSAESRPEEPPRHHSTHPRVTELKPRDTLRGHRLEVWSLALSPDRSTLVSGSKDGSVLVWDTSTVRRKQAYVTMPVTVRAWSFLPVGPAILALDDQGCVARWQGVDFQQSEVLLKLETKPLVARFSADGRFLATGSPKGGMQVWDLERCSRLPEVASTEGWESPVAFIGPSNHLVTKHGRDGGFREWDVMAGRGVRSWRLLSAPEFPWMCASSPDAEWFVALDRAGTGHLRHLATGRETQLVPLLKQASGSAFSPDGRLLAVVSILGTGQLWDTRTARTTATLQGFLQGTHSAAFSPGGRRLAIGSDGDEAIKLWDVESFLELLTLKGQGSMFNSTGFSPDDNVLASSNSRGTLHIWSAPSFEEIARLEAERR